MANERGLIYPNLPGNCPDEGYVLVSKRGFIEAPLSSENLDWEKLTQVTDADKQQIQTNKNDIADLKTDKQDKLTPGTNITIDENNVISATGGGGGGFTPTQAQLDAMNSGIDSTKVAQIATNTSDIANKVDKETGKGLSTNDFTNNDKTKLDDLVEVSGTNDGTNWTKITIDGVEKNIPSGGSGGGITVITKNQYNITQSEFDTMWEHPENYELCLYNNYYRVTYKESTVVDGEGTRTLMFAGEDAILIYDEYFTGGAFESIGYDVESKLVRVDNVNQLANATKFRMAQLSVNQYYPAITIKGTNDTRTSYRIIFTNFYFTSNTINELKGYYYAYDSTTNKYIKHNVILSHNGSTYTATDTVESSGGTTLYTHNIAVYCYNDSGQRTMISFTYINDSSTALSTITEVENLLRGKGMIAASGSCKYDSTNFKAVFGIAYNDTSSKIVAYLFDNSQSPIINTYANYTFISDTVYSI